jgi:hypothetical protein
VEGSRRQLATLRDLDSNDSAHVSDEREKMLDKMGLVDHLRHCLIDMFVSDAHTVVKAVWRLAGNNKASRRMPRAASVG